MDGQHRPNAYKKVRIPAMETKYLTMIRGMKKRGKKEWTVYVLRCGDNSLYTGIAKDVTSRLAKHQTGKGAAYTRTHLPVTLIYQENGMTRSAALIREAAIKRMPKARKEKLLCV
jgi:predicted GIY-YIG superfamily endonuclease